jgi:hypothetical protein
MGRVGRRNIETTFRGLGCAHGEKRTRSGDQQPTTAGETHGQITLRQGAKKERGGPGRAELIGG